MATQVTPIQATNAFELHFSVQQLAEMWNLSTDKVTELFESEPGVLTIGNEKPQKKRRYVTLRIPQSVAERVHQRLSAKFN